MRLHRFIGPFDLSKGILSIRDAQLLSQWRSVLRLEIGDSVILSDGAGAEALGTITAFDKRTAVLDISEYTKVSREPKKQVTLYAALLRRENFELVVQKATEIGIANIVPLLTERTVKTGFNRERLLKIIKEAAEQSGRTILPELSDPIEFTTAITQADAKETILFDLSGTIFKAESYHLKAISCFIGPEGGFSEQEVSLAAGRGIAILSLGALTLRAETAAIVVSYLATT